MAADTEGFPYNDPELKKRANEQKLNEYQMRPYNELAIKIMRKIENELNNYYLQIISFQDKDSQYQDIIIKYSKMISELADVIEDMRFTITIEMIK